MSTLGLQSVAAGLLVAAGSTFHMDSEGSEATLLSGRVLSEKEVSQLSPKSLGSDNPPVSTVTDMPPCLA